jgi:EAL domain-containing protein (putative c-di-GMP-specific phosphodiesterase class I)
MSDPSGENMRDPHAEGRPQPAGDEAQHAAALAELETRFERAMASMYLAYQPIVRATGGEVYGYEALMRPNDAEIPHPGAMLDAAERLHRLPSLGRHIRSLAAKRYGSEPEDRGALFLNIHALDLMDKQLASKWTPLAKIASRVVIEITERASLEDIADVKFKVAELRELGYRIAIDDLGAGHERMTSFDPTDTDVVKLDISLVRDIHKHPVKQQLASSIIQLCRENGILVIGEGVEVLDEARVLTDIGCDLLQGYYFAKPGPDFPTPTPH